jgi:hypothetical protein
MDQRLKDAIEQGKEQKRLGTSASQQTVNALITILANYAVSEATTLRNQLQDLKKRNKLTG